MVLYVMFHPDLAKHLRGIIHQLLFPNENVNKDVLIFIGGTVVIVAITVLMFLLWLGLIVHFKLLLLFLCNYSFGQACTPECYHVDVLGGGETSLLLQTFW